jgi:hypothetical protein
MRLRFFTTEKSTNEEMLVAIVILFLTSLFCNPKSIDYIYVIRHYKVLDIIQQGGELF